jgi:enamine deaminase RidA (YjgF/YER057c/UK114 family)
MSFTFSASGIVASGTDYISFVRWKLDDINASAYEIENEAITALYTEVGAQIDQATRNYLTAIKAGNYLVTKYTKMASFSSAGTSVQLRERAEAWKQRIAELSFEMLQYTNVGSVIYPYRPPPTVCY